LPNAIQGLISHTDNVKFIYNHFSLWKNGIYCIFIRFPHIHCDVFNVMSVSYLCKALNDCFLVTIRLNIENGSTLYVGQYKTRFTDDIYFINPKPFRSLKLVLSWANP